MKKNLFTLLALLFASALCAAEYTVDFSNKLRDSALKSHGFMHRKAEILITEDEGNKCISLGGEKRTAVRFDFAETVEAGEISFRFKSVDWDCTSPNSHFLATFVSGPVRLMLYTQPNKRGHFLFHDQQTKYRAGGIVGKFIWQKNEWHTIKVVWDAKTSTLYMDGKRIANIKNSPEFKGWSGVSLGTYYLWKNSGTGTTLFDDFHFSDETVKKKVDLSIQHDKNLASKSYNSYVTVSSFADYKKRYSDNLNDGDTATVWQAKEPGTQWIKIINDGMITADTLLLACSNHKRGRLWCKTNGESRFIGEFGAVEKFSFPAASGDLFMLELTPEENETLCAGEIALYGDAAKNIPPVREPAEKLFPIWYPEKDSTYKVNSPRFFRFEFDLEDMNFVYAFLQPRSNDYFKAYINGKEVCTGAYHGFIVDIRKFLKPGRNLLAFECDLKNPPNRWGVGTLMAKVQINYKNQSRIFVTDRRWKSSDVKADNWYAPEFDASNWKPAIEFSAAAAANYAWADFSIKPQLTVKNLKLSASELKPGDKLSISLDYHLPKDKKAPYFRLDLVSSASNEPFMRVLPQTADGKLYADFVLPPWLPTGKNIIKIAAADHESGKPYNIVISGNNFTVKAPENKTTGQENKLIWKNSYPFFEFDGVIQGPFCWNVMAEKFIDQRCHFYRANGNGRLFTLYMGKRMVSGDSAALRRAFDAFDKRATHLISAVPDAKIAIWFDLRPSAEWLDAHPEERMIEADGKLGPVSYSSELYMRETRRIISEMNALLKTRPYYKNIAVLHPDSWGISDSGIGGLSGNTFQLDRNKLNIGDHNPQSIKKFRQFLRERYRTDAELQKAWCDKNVTFDTAAPTVEGLRKAPADNGAFVNPAEGRMRIDYAEFLPKVHMRFYQEVFRQLKTEYPGRLVRVIYGWPVSFLFAYNTPGFLIHNGNFSFNELLRDPNVDIFSGSLSYHHRLADRSYATGFPPASMRLHKKLYMADADYRTFVAGPVTWGRQRSRQETTAVLRKNLAFEINNGVSSWAPDMNSGNSGRLSHPWNFDKSVLETRKLMAKIREEVTAIPRKNVTQIAVFSQAKTAWYLDIYRGANPMYNLINRTLWESIDRLGAPYDLYLMDDITHKDFPDHYKMYIILNGFVLSPEERAALNKLKRDGKTLLFIYAPGYIDPEKGNNVAQISELTGIKTCMKPDAEWMKMSAVSGNILNIPAASRVETIQHHPAKSKLMHPVVHKPVFYTDDSDAKVIYKFADGKTAMAVKDFGSWKSIYSAIPYMDVETLRQCAKFAGVHLYFDTPVFSSVSDHLIMVHNGKDKNLKTVLTLLCESDIFNADDGSKIAAQTKNLPLDIPPVTTMLLRIKSSGR